MLAYEATATAFAFMSTCLAAKNSVYTWPCGIVSILLALFILHKISLHADTALHAIYLILYLYGWYSWSTDSKNTKPVHARYLGLKRFVICCIPTIILAFILIPILKHSSDSLPYMDAFTTSFAILALVLTAKKYIENWFIWTVTDMSYVYMYAHKHLYIMSGKHFIYLFVAAIGLYIWHKDSSRGSYHLDFAKNQ
ncbi:MAG: hypothetical protein COB50_02145 [Thiotrichales bacterium]|nr:MAG: hypothetical protein COB50_02145 [Thiotrichales bacterium]